MPECSEVRLNADFLKQFENKEIKEIHINSGQFLKRKPKRLKTAIFQNIFNSTTVVDINSLGKMIYGRLELKISRGQDLYFISTLGMSGFWTDQDLKHNHLSIEFKDGTFVHYNDARRFGHFNFVTEKEMFEKLHSLGVNFLDVDSYLDIFYTKKGISERIDKIKDNTQICKVLLDQSIFAGVGNYIKCETLYASEIHPATLWKDIDNKDLHRLFNNCYNIIQESYKLGGASFKTFKDSSGKKNGQYQTKFQVYGRKTTPDGFEIKKEKFQDGRTTFYCPFKQKIKNAN